MPGVSLKCIISKNESNDFYLDRDEKFSKELESRTYNDSYKTEILLKQGPYMVGCTKYEGYPVKTFENSEYWVCLEGMIYNKEKVDDMIFGLLNHVFVHELVTDTDKEIISNQFLQIDGDFIIYALDKRNGNFVIMNDILGRLPLYYYKRERELIVSRELPFLVSLTDDGTDDDNRFDKMAMAQYLLLGFPLGKRTLLTDVSRLEPASILRICGNSEFKIENIHRLNFDNTRHANKPTEINSSELVSLFNDACKNRVSKGGSNILCLTGGFDSRGVLACFHKNKIPAHAFTLLDPKWTPVVGSASDAEVAEQLTKSVNFPWKYYDFIKPKPGDLLKLIKIKTGFPYVANQYLLPSLESLKATNPSTSNIVFTGHGGEIIRQSPYRNEIKSLDFLVNIITKGTGSFSINDVAALLRLKETEITDEIRNVLSSYPEKNMDKKYLHLLYSESSPWIFFESEDIIRHYFWTTSPYYSVPFFYYAVNCPEENKSNDALYKQFLGALSPSILEIRTSNWGCPVVSFKYKILQFIYSNMWKHSIFYKIVRKMLLITWKYKILNKALIKKDNRIRKDNSKVICCLREQINACHDISRYLSPDTIKQILNDYDNLSDVGIHNLFDLTLLMETVLCNRNTIKSYFKT